MGKDQPCPWIWGCHKILAKEVSCCYSLILLSYEVACQYGDFHHAVAFKNTSTSKDSILLDMDVPLALAILVTLMNLYQLPSQKMVCLGYKHVGYI
jgi:hypothetical protein